MHHSNAADSHNAERTRREYDIRQRRLQRRFVLDVWKLRNFHGTIKNEATVDVRWICCTRQPHLYPFSISTGVLKDKVCSCHTHIGVGFCVARSIVLGNAKASKRGTSDTLPRFFVSSFRNLILIIYPVCLGACQTIPKSLFQHERKTFLFVGDGLYCRLFRLHRL